MPMTSEQKSSGERLVLFTFIDLLIQIIFVLLLVFSVWKRDLFARTSQADGELVNLREDLNSCQESLGSCQKSEAELSKEVFGGVKPCLCRGEVCRSKSDIVRIATFEIQGDAIKVLRIFSSEHPAIPKLISKANLVEGQSVAISNFSKTFSDFKVDACKYYVSYTDGDPDGSRKIFKKAQRAIYSVFAVN